MSERVRWNDAGLAPAIVQDAATGRVLMLGWMNAEALAETTRTGLVHFFSRRRQALWRKGETSGNELRLRSLSTDCDRDALLVQADPVGPTCHTGAVSCFFEPLHGPEANPEELGPVLAALGRTIRERAAERPEASYTARLLSAGTRRIAQKVGEEAVEVALAAAAGTGAEVASEAADLLYHLLVLLEDRGVAASRVAAELSRRAASRASASVNRRS